MARFNSWRARQHGRALGNQHQRWLERFDATDAGREFRRQFNRVGARREEIESIVDRRETARSAYLLEHCKCDLCGVLRSQAARRKAAESVDVGRLTGDNPQESDDREQFDEQQRGM